MKMFMKLTVVVLSVFAATQAVAQDWMIHCPAGYTAYRSPNGVRCIVQGSLGAAAPSRTGGGGCFVAPNGQVHCL